MYLKMTGANDVYMCWKKRFVTWKCYYVSRNLTAETEKRPENDYVTMAYFRAEILKRDLPKTKQEYQ
jgi:hypothetical protein